jgi:hypothetical protein
MAKFTVEYQNKYSADVAFSKVKELLTKGDDLKKYDSSLQCKFNDQKMTCQIKGGKFGAELIVAPQGASTAGSVRSLLLLERRSRSCKIHSFDYCRFAASPIKGGKFGAELIVAPQGASLSIFKSKVQDSLSRMLHKHLG